MSMPDLARRIQEALADHRPHVVEDVITRSGLDNTGSPAVWIMLILKDEAPSRATIEQLQEWAVQTTFEATKDAWPYVVFRTKNEQAELERETKAR
jgi:hypothetical protein